MHPKRSGFKGFRDSDGQRDILDTDYPVLFIKTFFKYIYIYSLTSIDLVFAGLQYAAVC